jgi:hypothetical protein
MAIGALVDVNGNVVASIDAASGLSLQFEIDGNGNWLAFVPDAIAQPGDTWTQAGGFVYTHVPASVTPLQARQALDAAGLRPQAEAAIAAAGQQVVDWWQFSPAIDRANPLVNQIAGALGLSSAQVDALFRSAATF